MTPHYSFNQTVPDNRAVQCLLYRGFQRCSKLQQSNNIYLMKRK